MAELLVTFTEPTRSSTGDLYYARAFGQIASDGLWEGWLEFVGIDESSEPIASDRETTQPNRVDLEYWAQGLSRVYLQGALARAETRAQLAREGKEERPTA